ncbi:MAG TPA: serine/threonine protein kinase [Bacillales bacterium]|nr:serine/threonine protein kinase [Bacillales bacterium]
MSNTPVTVNMDDVSFQLREPHHFDWLRDLGRVFRVFDQQDSGNLCFGIVGDGGRRQFVKYAGARTLNYEGDPKDAVDRLKQAVPVYEALEHPNLIELTAHFEAGSGYAAVFEWFDGEGLHPHWAFPPPAKYNHPDSPFYRYRQLPVGQRLASLDNIFSFHVQVESRNYVAIDFYDGSLLYDFQNGITKICDIDMYHRKPFTNAMGRMWGSSRFMSTEEFTLGAEIDGRTNVFNMGATAFVLLGGGLDRSFSGWEASRELYDVAFRAVEDDRDRRYPSVDAFYLAWKKALAKTA